ncbi:unnamed protein product [Cylicocyclus nassatus]|uniref:Uncharacterized protein n=1 Tax=Cylicocyclus nassatus TaxID=53992 RepID=A0AA36GS29_CYLNA|nr:unnamed protein product [Cylicocyclus nassatus]
MASQNNGLKDFLDIVAQIEHLKLKKELEPLSGDPRDVERLGKHARDFHIRPAKIAITDTVKAQLYTVKEVKTEGENNIPITFGSGAAIFTMNEITFTENEIIVPRKTAMIELFLRERICVRRQQKFIICQSGVVAEGLFVRPLPSRTKLIPVEKLMENCEFIPVEYPLLFPSELFSKIGAEPGSSKSGKNEDERRK